MEIGSKTVSSAAIKMALTESREDENKCKELLKQEGIRCCAVDFGGEFLASINKIIERAVVSAKREGVIGVSHSEEGSVAGAAREAASQIVSKALGFNVGGKIGIARCDDHISVALYFGIGLLHLNEVAIGLGHRVI